MNKNQRDEVFTFIFNKAGGAWLSLYEQRIGRELTKDEVMFAYCFYKQAAALEKLEAAR
jgi:hypothetical protein